jgi:hypothetical protein
MPTLLDALSLLPALEHFTLYQGAASQLRIDCLPRQLRIIRAPHMRVLIGDSGGAHDNAAALCALSSFPNLER